MHGLRGNGWFPVVDFSFDNQAVVGVPGKGSYIFYDRRQISADGMFRDIQRSIDENQNFVHDFRRRKLELFGALVLRCMEIEEANLELCSKEELLEFYENFLEAFMVGPIITVQLWGIEACLDDQYRIMGFLMNKLAELGKSQELQRYKEVLSINTGETVPLTERKDFYKVAQAIDSDTVREAFRGDTDSIVRFLENHERENRLIEKHRSNYEWMNKEYTGAGWTRERWLSLFREALMADVSPEQQLLYLERNLSDLIGTREAVIKELDPPADVLHALDALAELIADRDWSKGMMTKFLLSYHKLLAEMAARMGVPFEDLYQYSYIELSGSFSKGDTISKTEIEDRKANGFVILIKGGVFQLITGKENVEQTIAEEKLSEPFEKAVSMDRITGLSASRGKITGRARVLEDAAGISELQEGEILVTYMTTIEFTPAFRRAAAVVTDEGGMSCHAAIVSREFRLPCVVGTRIGTKVIQSGDLIEVDADHGVVRILERAKETL